MADLSDAAQALVLQIAAILYPAGAASASLTGDVVLIYQGTPSPLVLASDLAAGKLHVSVFPEKEDHVTSVSEGDDDWEEVANNGTTGTAVLELRRQTRVFRISVWAGTFGRRDAVASAIDAGLAAVSRLALADGSQGVMTYAGSAQIDDEQKAGVYRRDLLYAVNYATTQIMSLYAVTQTLTDVTVAVNASDIGVVSVVGPSPV